MDSRLTTLVTLSDGCKLGTFATAGPAGILALPEAREQAAPHWQAATTARPFEGQGALIWATPTD